MSFNSPYNGQFDVQTNANQSGHKHLIVHNETPIIEVAINGQHATLKSIKELSEDDTYAACRALFSYDNNIKSTCVKNTDITDKDTLDVQAVIQRASLWQSSYKQEKPAGQIWPQGELYKRFDSNINAWVSLQTVSIEKHAQLFSDWQNNPRVAEFWQETGTLEQHTHKLKTLLNSSVTHPIIGLIDNEPFAYFEVYWAQNDRIAPFYGVQEYDKGIHMLVGEEHHRGAHKVNAWLSSLCHFIFLQDKHTQRIVSEPRSDNEKMIRYLQQHQFKKLKEFDFPHKRAALMMLSRNDFLTTKNI